MKARIKFELINFGGELSGPVTTTRTALNACFARVEAQKSKDLTEDEYKAVKKKASEAFGIYTPPFVDNFRRPDVRTMKLQVAEDVAA